MVINKKNIQNFSNNLSNIDKIKGRSLWSDARIRFFKNKAAVVSLISLCLIILFSFLGPIFT